MSVSVKGLSKPIRKELKMFGSIIETLTNERTNLEMKLGMSRGKHISCVSENGIEG